MSYTESECRSWLINPHYNPKTGKKIGKGDLSVFVDLSTSTINTISAVDIFTINREMFEIIGLDEFFTPEYN